MNKLPTNPAESVRMTLAQLVELAAAGESLRDELFVRTFTRWLHERADRIRFSPIAELQMQNVVLTFKMKGSVTLIATGHHPTLPGELTLRIDETEFPFVTLTVGPEAEGEAYDFCTLDYSVQGRKCVLVKPHTHQGQPLTSGTFATVIVAATLGDDYHFRARLDADGSLVNLPTDSVKLL